MTDIIDELSDLRACLDWPDEFEDLTGRAVPQLEPRAERSCRRRWPLVAVAALVVVGTVVPAVAHFLSIGAVSIELTGEGVPDDLATDLDLGTPTDLRADEARPPDLGDPSAAFAGKPPGGYTEVDIPFEQIPPVRGAQDLLLFQPLLPVQHHCHGHCRRLLHRCRDEETPVRAYVVAGVVASQYRIVRNSLLRRSEPNK